MKKALQFLMSLVLMLIPIVANAQFTIVDAESKEPLPGVYIFAENGTLLTMSNEKGEVKGAKGKVTLSILSYEPLTVDATELKGEVALIPKAYALSDVVVSKNEYRKLSAVFRDVVSNHDKVVLYREGIVDYYYSYKSKKWTRRIRGCRQYEHPNLRHYSYKDPVACCGLRLFDLNKVRKLKESGNTTENGDTTIIGLMNGKTEVKDAAMEIKGTKTNTARLIIDDIKFHGRNYSFSVLGLHINMYKRLMDWTFNTNDQESTSLKAYRVYEEAEADGIFGKKMPIVPIISRKDLVVYEETFPPKEVAKAEMKEKDITTEFQLPDCLPAIPPTLIEEGKKLEPKEFHDF